MKVKNRFFLAVATLTLLGTAPTGSFNGRLFLSSAFSQDTVAVTRVKQDISAQSNKRPVDFSSDGAGGTQESAGTRGPCLATNSLRLTALSPSSNYGRTISPQPKFWFYLPQISEQHGQGLVGEFGVLDASGTPLFDPINLIFPEQAGYVGISLPTNVSLEVGSNYEWYFSFNCDVGDPATTVSGWVQRIDLAPELISQINQSDQDAYDVYVENQIWFDIIDYFTTRRLEESENDDLRMIWSELLKAKGIELDALPSGPILLQY